MGVISITTAGSFPAAEHRFSAQDHGHAHAVARAVAHLVDDVLPWAIAQDHRLQAEGAEPRRGWDT